MVYGYGQLLLTAGDFLELKRVGQTQIIPVTVEQAVFLGEFRRPDHAVGALRRGQVETIHLEFILLCFPPEDGMIVQQQAGLVFFRFPGKGIGGAQAGEAATHDHHIEYLPAIFGVGDRGLITAITNTVGGVYYLCGVAVGAGVVADPTVAGPVFADVRKYSLGRSGTQ